MQDVADRAGVSLATASFVINGKATSKVSDATRDRVLVAAGELDYRPNAMARQLSLASSSFLGLVADGIATTPFAGALIRGAQDAAWEHGQVLLIADTGSEPRAEREAVAMMLEHQVRGIVYSSWYHREVHPPPELEKTTAVLANCYVRGDAISSFVPDEVQGGRSATELLLESGHRRVGFITSSLSAPGTTGRLRGYKDALKRYGVTFEPELVTRALPEQEGGYLAGGVLLSLKDPPSAVFCYNDRMAMGFYDLVRERSLSIPGDVAVVGFDNQEIIAAHLRPTLSTVALPHYELGYQSVNWLLDQEQSRGPSESSRSRVVCPRVVRESV
jgi:LacI family transcriptional regulator